MPLLLLILVGAVVLLMPRKAMGYVMGHPVELELWGIGGRHRLRADAAASFLNMKDAALNAGVELIVNESFRSMEEQTYFWDVYQGGGALAAKPGFSNHQGGIALDIDLVDAAGNARPAAQWLATHAHKYGWERTIPSEPWHWEYRP